MAGVISIKVTDQISGTVTEQTFSQPVIRVGRNPLNDLVVSDATVSQFHALVEVAPASITIKDVGSTNGVVVPGVGQLEKGRPAPLPEQQPFFQILHLLFEVTHRVEQAAPPAKAPSLSVTNLLRSVPGDLIARFVGASLVDAAVKQLEPNYQAARAEWGRLIDEIRKASGAMAPPQRQAYFEALSSRFPALGRDPDFVQAALVAGVQLGTQQASDAVRAETVALQGVRELAAKQCPQLGSPETPAQLATFLTNLHDTLSVFIRTFVPLRDGYQQLTDELSLSEPRSSVVPSRTNAASVADATTPEELALALLRWDVGEERPTNQVEQTLADLMIHQVALISGVMTGVKALVAELSPDRISSDMDSGRTSGGPSFGPFRHRALWKVLEQRHRDIAGEESQLFSLVFGNQFARAYSRVAEGNVPSPSNTPADGRNSQLP